MLLPSAPGLVMATNHWSVSMGSITTPVRSPRGTISLCGLVDYQQTLRFEVGDDLLARLEAVHAAILFGAVLVDPRIQGQDRDRRQAVAVADLPVVEVVGRSDLDATGAEFLVDIGVGDDRNGPVGQRQMHDCLPTRWA
jgi:hypothetical protein